MQSKNYSFEHLPFSTLFKTYVDDFGQLKDYYEVNPFNEKEIARKVQAFEFRGDRNTTADVLTSFNKRFDADSAVFENIHRLRDDNSLAVVTGQQLGLYGGPIYTVLKAIGTIHTARKMEKRFNRPVIPVFWLADEDHDYDEVRNLHLLQNDELKRFELPAKTNHLSPVADLTLPDELEQVRTAVQEALHKTEFFDDLWDLLDQCFTPGNTFLDAFGQWMAALFSKQGLVLAGSNHREVKQLTGACLKRSIAQADEIRQQLEEQSQALGQHFHQQVHLYDSNLFYLDPELGRMKINRNGNGWKTDNGKNWQTDELIEAIDSKPEYFSPNVFLRPLVQDVLLPTLGYVAGPGEIAYYGQMKKMYPCFDLQMPIIFPRLSATIIEPAIARIKDELPFRFHEYDQRIEDLESAYVEKTSSTDIRALFAEWKKEIEQIAEQRKEQIAGIDATLEASAEKTTALYFNELDRLSTKVYRAVKKQDEIQLKRIRRIQNHLFPENELQERVLSTIFYMNIYGVDIWDKVLDLLDEDEAFDQHKLVYP